MRCPRCGEEGEGSYCAICGAPLAEEEPGGCPSCGAAVRDADLYCAECGEPVKERPDRSLAARLPWILSGLALLAFAVAIGLFVRSQASPRTGDQPPTGGVVSGGGARMQGADPGAAAGETGAAGGMPSAEELSDLSPRQAGDRLFNRAMRLRAEGDTAGRAPFFARMGIRAYRQVPAEGAGPDLRFHVGLLELVREEPAAARAQADSILAAEPGHLLGLYLAVRAAEAAGDEGRARGWRDSLRSAADRADLDGRPEYRAHRALLEELVAGEEGS